ncbi:PREDICTED: uncharacterized protein LOC108767941 [Trachymyrmex cornetzi]|uniref:THAP-type domain-containing protein n=1 Tax=Trachymyrmex cornetzi TaxID=471704 RepID=A0A151IVQ9_9HYME|nr:PREDICTED: uncharacterized protein LOC108767941 [Trachymyrmex cornetzi]KYN11761.1 hypothetical protein ALC57_16095 [Trachymyrmex cornetzi]
MVRACCIPGCLSGQNVPSHMFPKDIERHKQWFKELNMKVIEDEKELKKLRICYQHFRNEDYTNSPTRRTLEQNAIPSINVLQHADGMNVEHISQHTDGMNVEHIPQHTDGMNVEYIPQHTDGMNVEHMPRHTDGMNVEHIPQHADIEHGKQHTNTVQEILAQHSSQLQKHEQVIMQQRNDIQNMKKTLSNQRPILGEVTRVHLLSPTAKKLYSTVIAMKRAKRRLKRLFDKGGKRKRIHTTSKRNTDSTAQIRRNFINMLQRNSDVKSQVYTSSL